MQFLVNIYKIFNRFIMLERQTTHVFKVYKQTIYLFLDDWWFAPQAVPEHRTHLISELQCFKVIN